MNKVVCVKGTCVQPCESAGVGFRVYVCVYEHISVWNCYVWVCIRLKTHKSTMVGHSQGLKLWPVFAALFQIPCDLESCCCESTLLCWVCLQLGWDSLKTNFSLIPCSQILAQVCIYTTPPSVPTFSECSLGKPRYRGTILPLSPPQTTFPPSSHGSTPGRDNIHI